MTDRELPRAAQPPRTSPDLPSGDPYSHTHPDSVLRGDSPPMTLTLATRPRAFTTDAPPADPVRDWLAQLFAPQPDLVPFAPPPLALPNCTPAEAAAVARAVACPDLFVFHAPDPAAGERIIGHIVATAAQTDVSARILILSPHANAADRISERLVNTGLTSIVRALAEDENPARPSPVVARHTSQAIGTARVEQLRRESQAAIATIETRHAKLQRVLEVTEQLAFICSEHEELARQNESIAAAVRGEAVATPSTAFTAELQQRLEVQCPVLAEYHSAIATQQAHQNTLAALRQQHEDMTPKPGFFARLLGKPKSGHDQADLDRQIHETELELEQLRARVATLQAETDALTPTAESEREAGIRAEIERRQSEIANRMAALQTERGRLQQETGELARTFESPAGTGDNWEATQTALSHELQSARQNHTDFEQRATELARQLLTERRIVVGVPGSLFSDPVFDALAAASTHEPDFTLLILDRAEELTEPDFVNLAKLASRWILIGNIAGDNTPSPGPTAATRFAPGRNGRTPELRFATRLARILDREVWACEGERLVCHLAHLTLQQRHEMVQEPLLDHPEIELRFSIALSGEPILAEVVFPASLSVVAAKEFLFHELGEVLLRTWGEVVWHETPTTLMACWPTVEHADTGAECWLELEHGIREKLVGQGSAYFTAAVAFDRAAGWDHDRAAEWLGVHLISESASRFATILSTTSSSR